MRRPDISFGQILALADDFKARVGRWPQKQDGPIAGAVDLTWYAVDQALRKGHRGLPGGSTLAQLLLRCRRKRHRSYPPPLTLDEILRRLDAYHAWAGGWPTASSGRIPGTLGETWLAVDKALRAGRRGLPGGSFLAHLLEVHRGVRNPRRLPPLKPAQVLAWVDAHKRRTGRWPTRESGRVPEAPGETWNAINGAFVGGLRGLAGYGSLARFLARHRGVRNPKALPKLSLKRIRQWVQAYYVRHGRWPKHTSGPIEGAPGETWGGIHSALCRGGRGLPGGSSLYRVRGRSPR